MASVCAIGASVMLKDIDHIQLAMPKGQERAAIAFYGGLLGLQEIEKPESLRGRGGVWFAIGSRQVHLGVQEDFRPATKAHPAFLVDDLARLRDALRAQGFPTLPDEPLPGYERFFSRDPFGNRLEFLKKL